MTSDPYENLSITTGAVADPNTSLVNETGSWREFLPEVDPDACTTCGLCEQFCPDMAIKESSTGDTYAVDKRYCKGCGICAKECPVDAIEMKQEVK